MCFFDCSDGHIEKSVLCCMRNYRQNTCREVDHGALGSAFLQPEPMWTPVQSWFVCPWLISLPTTVPDYFDLGPIYCLFWWMASFCYCSLLLGDICSAVGTSPSFSIRCARVWFLDQPGIRHTLWEQASAILDSNIETGWPRVFTIIWQALDKHLIFFSIPISFILHSHFFFLFLNMKCFRNLCVSTSNFLSCSVRRYSTGNEQGLCCSGPKTWNNLTVSNKVCEVQLRAQDSCILNSFLFYSRLNLSHFCIFFLPWFLTSIIN